MTTAEQVRAALAVGPVNPAPARTTAMSFWCAACASIRESQSGSIWVRTERGERRVDVCTECVPNGGAK